MSIRKPLLRRLSRWGLWILGALLILFLLQLSILAYPQVLMSRSSEVGAVKIYTDAASQTEIDKLAADVDTRLSTCVFYDSSRTDRIFYFQNQSLYKFFVKLSLLPHIPQGFNLSILGNSYVSGATVAALAEHTGGRPRYSIYEGSPAHTIAHEIAHQYIVDSIGRSAWKRLPHWKREGLPEYIANIGIIRADSAAALRQRIEILNNDTIWARTWGWDRHGWDRIHYEAGLLVEFVFEVQNRSLEELVSGEITKQATLAAMMNWYEAGKP